MKKNALLTAFLLIISSAICLADTIHVPADQPTIQAGIDAAVAGDIVLVAPGTYQESIDFLGKAITVQSSGGAEVTVIDAMQAGSCVAFINQEWFDSVLDGFTITNGVTDQSVNPFLISGGINCQDGSSPIIRKNIITQNSTDYYGGGIYIKDSYPVILNNEISGNEGYAFGGGIFCWNGLPKIEGNIISSNHAMNGGGIGALLSILKIKNNTITQNESSEGGSGIYLDYSNATVTENTITSNLGSLHFHYGCGILCEHDNGSFIADNTITENTECYYGAGICCRYPGTTTIINNIISSNRKCGIYCVEGSKVLIEGNTIQANIESNGIVLYDNCKAVIRDNIISDHVVYYCGGGIYCSKLCELELEGNRILNNTGTAVNYPDDYSLGGGIYCNDSVISLCNDLIAGNLSFRGGGIACLYSTVTADNCTIGGNSIYWYQEAAVFKYESSLTMTNCILWNETPLEIMGYSPTTDVSYSCIRGGYSGTGNIDSDPLFVDAADLDFHLTYDSPCRDVGDNTAPGLCTHDFEGDPRVAGGAVDMGADEFYRHFYCTGQFFPRGKIQGKFVDLPGASPVGLFIGSGVIYPPLQHGWGEFYLQPPLMLLSLVPIPADGVLVVPATLPGTPPAPYEIPLQALIGWKLSNLFVIEVR